MSNATVEFRQLKSVQVVVEERNVTLEMTPDTWRTHVFSGIETIPEKLKAAFMAESAGHDLELLDLVRKSYKAGRVEARFEAPYQVSHDGKSPTVLRSVTVHLQFRQPEPYGARAVGGATSGGESDDAAAERGTAGRF